MNTQPIDFSSIGGRPVQQAPIDFSSIGGKRVDVQPAQGPAPEDHEGFLSAVGSDLAGAAKGIAMAGPVGIAYQSLKHAYDNFQSVKATGKTLEQQQSESEKGAGYNPVYRALAPAAQAVGANVPAMEQDAAKGDTAGVLGHAAVPTALAMSPLALEGAAKFAGRVNEAIPSVERAGQNFKSVMASAKTQPVPITDQLSSALSRYQELVDRGGSRSLAVTKLLKRITDPEQAPMAYQEARDFASNVSRLSADEYQRLTPVMKQQVGAIRVALNDAVEQAAGAVGKGDSYVAAMKEYAKAMRLKDMMESAKKVGEKVVVRGLQAAGAGAAGAVGYDIYREATK